MKYQDRLIEQIQYINWQLIERSQLINLLPAKN